MSRLMSFSLTTDAIRSRCKTVTRRVGWQFLKAGDTVTACEKCMGLKRGEKVRRLAELRILSVTRELLCALDQRECDLEGFPEMTPREFVRMFCEANKGVLPTDPVTRIEFEYV